MLILVMQEEVSARTYMQRLDAQKATIGTLWTEDVAKENDAREQS